MWDHRPLGCFAPHDKICDILRAAIKSRNSADMLSLRIWYSVIIHITYSLLLTCNFFQMLMQINRSNWGHLQKRALCPMLLYIISNLNSSPFSYWDWKMWSFHLPRSPVLCFFSPTPDSFISRCISSLCLSVGLPIFGCPLTSMFSLLHLLQSFSSHGLTISVSLL